MASAILQAIAHVVGAWPPEPYHWHTRLGVTPPTAVSVFAVVRPSALFSRP